MRLLMQLDFPAPVWPGDEEVRHRREVEHGERPAMSRPSPTSSGWVACCASGEARMSPSVTSWRCLFGTSTPIALRPGIGARMRTSGLAIAYAMSWLRPVTRLTFTPGASSSS